MTINSWENKYETFEYDIVVVGSGISGLICSLNISPEIKILIITKSELEKSNSSLAQGGIAASVDKINRKSHIEDTMKSGSYINKRAIVKQIVDMSDDVINNLLDLGVNFDKDESGKILFTKEGGHSERRILHCKDRTGEKIIEALLLQVKKRKNIDIFENTFAVDVLTEKNIAKSILLQDKDNIKKVVSFSKLVLASGGIGRLYNYTTNTKESTGDGIAIAIRCGAKLRDMEFVQFHPTAFDINIEEGFLISEAVRGEGGKLINSEGNEFMGEIHELKELAPRDIVAQAIFRELNSNRSVFLDIRCKSEKYLKHRFPKIYNHCLKYDINMSNDLIPITPVQHYFMGGIEVNRFGMTSVEALYAIGECANTRAHGANRLASNSLLESAAYGLIVSREINTNHTASITREQSGEILELNDYFRKKIELVDRIIFTSKDVSSMKCQIQNIMSNYASIEKSKNGLYTALNELEKMKEIISNNIDNSINFYELKNMLMVSIEIVRSSLVRKKSVGSHIISDRSS